MLIYFLKGRLPWDDIEANEDNQLAIKEKKVSVPTDLLCEGLPGNTNLIQNSLNNISST